MTSLDASTELPTTQAPNSFVDRRSSSGEPRGVERRQFSNSHSELSPPAREIALAIDQYKLMHRRKFITYEEIYDILTTLGYQKRSEPV